MRSRTTDFGGLGRSVFSPILNESKSESPTHLKIGLKKLPTCGKPVKFRREPVAVTGDDLRMKPLARFGAGKARSIG